MNHLKDFPPVETRPAPFEGLLRAVGSMAAICLALFLLLFVV
jgi:hypothetical protein